MEELQIDLSLVTTREELHSLLAKKLSFPEWYGMNWDAFWDCIGDPYLSKMPGVLILVGKDILEKRLPREVPIMQECLREYVEKNPDRKVIWYQ